MSFPRTYAAIFLYLTLYLTTGCAHAVRQVNNDSDNFPRVVANVSELRSGIFGAYPRLRLNGYHSLRDGGQGDLVEAPTDRTSPDNSCTVFVDAAGDRFYRPIDTVRSGIDLYQCGAFGTGNATLDQYDDAAFSNAIAAAARIGVPYGGQYARVICSAGIFLLQSGVVISPGQRIELLGQHASGVSGCQIKAASNAVTLITVNADVFRMDNVWLFGGNSAGSGSCLVLGRDAGISGSTPLNDTTISNSWISNCSNAGIEIHNAQGVFVNNTTVEIAYKAGIYSNISGSKNIAQRITINGSTFYKDVSSIEVIGTGAGTDGPSSDWTITGGSEFDSNASAGTCNISLRDTAGINITGNHFHNDANHDVCATAVTNLSVTNNSFIHGYGAALNCSRCSATTANNNNGSDTWLGYAVGFLNSGIFRFMDGGTNNVVMGNNFLCSSPHARFGLLADPSVSNTGVGPNMLACNSVAAYSVAGARAWSY